MSFARETCPGYESAVYHDQIITALPKPKSVFGGGIMAIAIN